MRALGRPCLRCPPRLRSGLSRPQGLHEVARSFVARCLVLVSHRCKALANLKTILAGRLSSYYAVCSGHRLIRCVNWRMHAAICTDHRLPSGSPCAIRTLFGAFVRHQNRTTDSASRSLSRETQVNSPTSRRPILGTLPQDFVRSLSECLPARVPDALCVRLLDRVCLPSLISSVFIAEFRRIARLHPEFLFLLFAVRRPCLMRCPPVRFQKKRGSRGT